MPFDGDTREQALAWLDSRINYERRRPVRGTAEFKLDRMRNLLERLSSPHERLPVLHITGTKGKGSTASLAAACLTAAGYRTGLFTSPHVHRFEERMTVDGAVPELRVLLELVRDVADAAAALDAGGPEGSPTYFELATAMAWLYFERSACQIAVLEVGLGGRLDATNLCRPVATAITNISYDHTDVLGQTLEAIAAEKAGITKPGVPMVSGVEAGPARDVVRVRCRREGAELFEAGRDITFVLHGPASDPSAGPPASASGQRVDLVALGRRLSGLYLPLAGAHQAANAAVALGLVELASRAGWPVSDDAVRRGMAGVSIPVRVEFFPRRPLVVIDAAHNLASTAALLATLRAHAPAARRRILIFAASRDKDAGGMLRLLGPEFDEVFLTRYASNTRGLPAERLRELWSSDTANVRLAADPAAAWLAAQALAGPDDLICATGSFFLAAEVRQLLLGGR